MSNPGNPSTVRFQRVLRAPPERVYRAFLDPEAWAKWLPPHGFTGKVHEMEPRVGGRYRMTFTNFGTQQSHGFGGRYLELVPHERLSYTAEFDPAMGLPGEMRTTVQLRAVFCGTEILIEQTGIPAAVPAEACCLGWQESLTLLALLVEPDIRQG